ncbi:hypothetical protein [Rhizobium leguminosarum]|uniref:hypothetical protein n=1 Tax=Rhizobium leguminosarum TaxID=384 RepID=UPI00098EA361|nr:hypothetical protein [Rhizobium leguminosarum]MBB5261743.1 hypothetical protein [Rhizobium leguminosarum]MDX6000614.1 hypothetical protein [Rhizobium leguminosarum]OOO44811.1 hypothetical protein BS629_26520 [Rhizobium leguminosarum bv. viciae USDA 2370]PUB65005.1 hypothetical protein DB728_09180 [Rhizobium leguminosarum bv. viciae USDA 2370]TBZ50807.1 hypothetical protein E0H42_20655 [Rhizobium leguminosarum bv. viciae]
MPKHEKNDVELVRTWILPPAATLGSSVRAKGILLELRARLPVASKKSLDIEHGELTLSMPASAKAEFHAVASVVASALKDIESLPVIPREIEDILSIKTSERHRWLKDGRLPSAGTRTVKLRGRARKITFHVFDPRVVEDLLDRGVVEEWREEDAAAAAENRRRAAYKAKLTRLLKKGKTVKADAVAGPDEAPRAELAGWEEFGRDGLLR